MQTDNERYRKMASLAQVGWWEADISAGYYLCSDFLCDLLGLEGDTISAAEFINMAVRLLLLIKMNHVLSG